MRPFPLTLLLAGSITLTLGLVFTASAQNATQVTTPANAQQLAAAQQKALIKIRKHRVDLLRDEIKSTDTRIESRLDAIIETLETITDSKDSRTKIARMKEETGKRLVKTVRIYDQKRAALKEELRNPRLQLTRAEKEKMIAVFDDRIAKRTNQILELHKSMPAYRDEERYTTAVTGDDRDELDYIRNEVYDQNRRMTSHRNTQRDAIVKQLDASLARLDRQERTLKSQLAGTTDPAARQALAAELEKNSALIAERRKQRLEALQPGEGGGRSVSLKEATDLDKALQNATNDLSREFSTLFQRYNTLLNELSLLHAAEASLATKKAS
jgi:hypothetical protein